MVTVPRCMRFANKVLGERAGRSSSSRLPLESPLKSLSIHPFRRVIMSKVEGRDPAKMAEGSQNLEHVADVLQPGRWVMKVQAFFSIACETHGQWGIRMVNGELGWSVGNRDLARQGRPFSVSKLAFPRFFPIREEEDSCPGLQLKVSEAKTDSRLHATYNRGPFEEKPCSTRHEQQ